MAGLILFMVGVRQKHRRRFVERKLAIRFGIINLFKLVRRLQGAVIGSGVVHVGQLITQQLVGKVIGAATNRAIFMDGGAEAGTLFKLLIRPAGFPLLGKTSQFLSAFITTFNGFKHAFGGH